MRAWLFAFACATPLVAGTIRVPQDIPEIGAAVRAAGPGDEVVVAAGLYTIDETISFPAHPITLRSERGPEETIIRMSDRPLRPGEASVLALPLSGGEGTRIEGFTITGGKAERGGGIYARNAAPTTIRGNRIIGNRAAKAGGGIYADYPRGLILEENRIEGNSVEDSAGRGGGICADGVVNTREDQAPWLLISRCEIAGNSAGEGGGIHIRWAGGSLVDCRLEGNEASRGGGAVWENEGSSAAVFVRARGCRIRNNRSAGDGGGLILTSGKWTQFYVEDSLFEANQAQERGGGIFLPFALCVSILRNRFQENEAGLDGGALYVEGRETDYHGWTRGAFVERNVFFRNRAGRAAGGAYLGTVGISRFEFNSVVRNAAGEKGGGILSYWPILEFTCTPWVIANSIIWGNEAPFNPDVEPHDWNSLASCFIGMLEAIDPDLPPYPLHIVWTNPEDPQLVDVEAGDLRLLPTSPAIDAGNLAASLDPDGTRADIGAFYYPHKTAFIRGEVDGDARLGLGDAVLTLEYLFAGRRLVCPKAADIDDDGRTTLTDPIRLLQYLFASGPPPREPFPAEGEDPTLDELRCVR